MEASAMAEDGEERERRTEATGVVLAGGRSRRMGRDKAALLLGGEPLLRRVVRRLHRALAEVLVVGPAELGALVPGVRVVEDTRPGSGPLASTGDALRAVATPWVFVVACDMPFVAPSLVRAMVKLATTSPEVDAVVLRTERGTEQLHAVYGTSCLPALDAQLAAGDLTFHHLLDNVRVREMPPSEAARHDPDGLSAFNTNAPEDWARALAIFNRLLTDF
jgi:molybdopterin-guanine dinucleotide biosynthesis protein A